MADNYILVVFNLRYSKYFNQSSQQEYTIYIYTDKI